jgi:hypothetical protein
MSRPRQPDEKVRINLILTSKVKEQIDEMQELSNASSLTEVLRKSLAVYQFLLDRRAPDGSVTLKNSDGSEEKIVLL